MQSVPSYGTHGPCGGEHVPMTHVHTHKDGDERHAHTVYYNICQV